MATIKTLLQAVCTALKPMKMKMYLFERPSAVDKAQTSFIVLSLTSIRNQIIGEDGALDSASFDWSDTTLIIELFVKDNVKAANPNEVAINEVETYAEQLKGLFPIYDSTTGVTAVKPRVIVPAHSDGNSFHYTRIHASLST